MKIWLVILAAKAKSLSEHLTWMWYTSSTGRDLQIQLVVKVFMKVIIEVVTITCTNHFGFKNL